MEKKYKYTEDEYAEQRKWIESQFLFQMGDVIEWTDCIALITEIKLGFPKGCDVMSKFQGIRIVYVIDWVNHPILEQGEKLNTSFEKEDALAYGIKLASDKWQVLYGKTKV